MALSKERLEFCTEQFLKRLSREFATRYPGRQSPIREFATYGDKERAVFMQAVAQAVKMAQPDQDGNFKAWQLFRAEATLAQSAEDSAIK